MLNFKKFLNLSTIVSTLTFSIFLHLTNSRNTNAADLIYQPSEDQSIPNSFLLNINFNSIEEFGLEINQILNNEDTIPDPQPPQPPEPVPPFPPIIVELDLDIEEMIDNDLQELLEELERELEEELQTILDQLEEDFEPEPIDLGEQPVFLEIPEIPKEVLEQAFTIPLKPRLKRNRELRNNLRNNESLKPFIAKIPEPNSVISLVLFSSLGIISVIKKKKL